jgi:hypothetical protein
VGITLWVIGSGRYEPSNFPTFTVDPSTLVWDWNTNLSNYSTVQQADETTLKDFGWQIESSEDVSPLTVENTVLYGSYAFAGGSSGSSSGGVGGVPASQDYLAVPAADGGAGETADQVRTADLSTLFPLGTSTVRITRMRGDLSRAALANDLVLQASADQSTLSNVYQVTQSVNLPVCPACNPSVDCGGSSGSSGAGLGASSGSSSGASSGASTAASDGGTGSLLDKPRDTSFTCAMAPGETTGAGLALGAGGLALAALAGARRRKDRRDRE